MSDTFTAFMDSLTAEETLLFISQVHGIEPAVAGLLFADVHLDARRYLMPIRPVTIAIRAEHVVNAAGLWARAPSFALCRTLGPSPAGPLARVEWWLHECDLPAQTWARMRVFGSPVQEATVTALGADKLPVSIRSRCCLICLS